MDNDNKLKTEPDKELVRTAFEQLNEHIRHQDNLCHSYTNYYLSIQAGLAIAFSFLLQNASKQTAGYRIGTLGIPILGIVTAWCLTLIIWREQRWAGRFIIRLRQLTPELVYLKEWGPPDEPDPIKKGGLGYMGKMYMVLAIVLTLAWVAACCFALTISPASPASTAPCCPPCP